MRWEEKLGLLAGAGVVLAVALIFHRPESKARSTDAPTGKTRAASLSPMLPAKVKGE